MWLWSWTDSRYRFLCCRYEREREAPGEASRARSATKTNEKRYRRDRANADDAAAIRVMLHRVGAVDAWERKRLDQAAQFVRADAVKQREGCFTGIEAAVDRMRERGQTLAAIAALVEVEVRDIRVRVAQGSYAGHRRTGHTWQARRWFEASCSGAPDVTTGNHIRSVDTADGGTNIGASGAHNQDSTRCIRCAAVMLDVDARLGADAAACTAQTHADGMLRRRVELQSVTGRPFASLRCREPAPARSGMRTRLCRRHRWLSLRLMP